MDLISMLGNTQQVQSVLENQKPGVRQLLTGLSGSAKTLFLATIYKQQRQPLLIIESNMFQANQVAEDLANQLNGDQIYTFPVEEVMAAEIAVSSPESRAERVRTLSFLATGKKGIVVTSVAGMRRLLPTARQWRDSQTQIEMGGEVDPKILGAQLAEMGYHRDKLVGKPGEFAMRGDIIDIFPLDTENPVRIELFDTEVDAIRSFEADTQRSIENLESVAIMPATDLLANAAQLEMAGEALQADYQQTAAKITAKDDQKALAVNFETPISRLLAGERLENLALFVDYLYPDHTSLIDYFKNSGLVVFDDYPRIQETQRVLAEEAANWQTDMLGNRRLLPAQKLLVDVHHLMKQDQHPHLYLSLFQKGMGKLKLDTLGNMPTRNVQQFFSQMPLLKTEMSRWQKQQQTVVVLVSDAKRVKKIDQTFHDFEIEATVTTKTKLVAGQIQIVQGSLQNGFELPDLKLVVLTEKELFNTAPKKKVRRQTLANAERLKSYSELKPGDYVVHVNHGIGEYVGMETLEVDGVHQDYITILYRDNGKLFIPVTQLDMVQKYVSAESKTPKINKLGGAEWQKTKSKVSAKIEDIADDLIELYAQREAEKGYAFPEDDQLQADFENQFAYPETDDQLRSTAEIKHDMEKVRPMDRLLVGDVGFGKTEVALRAAFKAVAAGKQVAFLVPTTILAQQHYENMLARFADFPVELGLLSRFKTRKEVTATLKGLEKGQVDIVIGTHRLLSKDVVFKDLGLLIVDEEQRFGVKHKERLKQLKAQVDVLTLTATPIPRTLHMSMLGVRDLSVIETPPTNRYPIQTYVMEQNAGAMREAIERELERNGQVFYLHNRVSDIEQTVDEIQALVPEATVGYAHGQMTEAQLEGVIYDFVQGKYDVLVTTTIIETGVDMPNVNTMIVEDADHYGLSQLYQLRGRIGRSSRVAYGYFMYKPDKVLTEVSEKRLQAIKDFTELGSGFKIAMRDLSIRGAGNLLGKQQHGFIDSVGFDLYSQMLSEAVAKKQGKKVAAKTDAEIDLKLEAYLPDDYINDQRQKIEIYKRIRQMDTEAAFTEIQSDLIDRFGDYPVQVAHLLTIGQLKMNADDALIETIKQVKDKIQVVLSPKGSRLVSGEQIFEALSATRLKATVGFEQEKLSVTLIIQPKMKTGDWLRELAIFVETLVEIEKKQLVK
ncbi:transcription-repair coupling factor [Latilactobacillus sakei]|uniref:transcription-repair coupling factor n=1 Tax=Latilactobacillus sakei TaxID=1599 RepID=UPI00033F0834|nr:transcription-repair coupling factor [Latilactobacillus sakei]EOR84155.1 transcription-repair coupling factor [Latilactobacillus sakei subsp. sakei LS25]PKX63235.1 transcription-repair coupling factor [Latilactobacillus sakei]PKX68907.1 transcription-repair coupling factor [Latilactobacillus sakei]